MSRRIALPVALALAVIATLGPAAGTAPAARTSLPDIEDEVMCPICGTALNLSQSPQAERERVFIRRRIAEGMSKQQIKDALVAEYGPEVLATPQTSGFDLAAWVVPGLAILLAGGALSVGIRRWRAAGAGEESEPAPEPAVDGEAERRLEADLGRYEL